MASMRRADRRGNSDDNAMNHPRSRGSEPIPYQELRQLLGSARATQRELQDVANAKEQEAEHNHRLYLEEQQKHQTSLTLYQEVQQTYQTTLTQYEEVRTQARSYLMQYEEAQTQAKSYFTQFQEAQTQVQSYSTLYQEAQTQFQSYLTLYESEKARGDELSVKFEQVQAERDRYLMLYNESQGELKFERRSKAGIKGWETRRKRENERLKQEITEMTVLLRDSLARKDEAVNSLYVVAERMDRIQRLVDSVDEDTTNPVGMLQKLQRIWQAAKEILAE
jgi:chromosome segregation ATPase